MEAKSIIRSFEELKVLVVGDMMLDVYLKGVIERISPEAPVPVVMVNETDKRPGGAGNVAVNCKSLGANVFVAGVLGNDSHGNVFIDLLKTVGIDTHLLRVVDGRTTTTKTRVFSKSQQIARFDEEQTEDIALKEEHAFISDVLKFLQISRPDVVIIEDYNKGLMTENIILQIVKHCKVVGIPIAVDPKKKNFLLYQGVDIFKPNLKEIAEGLAISLSKPDLENLMKAHEELKERLAHKISFFTLSEKGVFYSDGENSGIIQAHRRNIADVSGAGDTVISVAALVYAVTKDVKQMAEWSNIAGGLVCEESGVVPIDKNKLLEEVENKLKN